MSGISSQWNGTARPSLLSMVRDFGTPRSTVEEGALAILKLAISAEIDGRSGLYFNGQEEARADAQAYDSEARQCLKRLSFELTGLSFG